MTATAEPVELPETTLSELPAAAAAAHAAIGDAGRKLRRARRRFLEREDVESLHALRVSLRRLRAALNLFRTAIVVPRRLGDRALRRVGHDLADLRDQDVALEAIVATPEEAAGPPKYLRRLERRRRREARRVAERLRGTRVRSMLRALRRWDQSPAFTVDEDTPVTIVLTGLRSRVAAIDLHPAWSLTMWPDASGALHAPESDYDDLTTADLLHQLRRRIKQVRYQVEFVDRVLAPGWQPVIERMRILQESLGVMQDARVLDSLTAVPRDRLLAASAAWDELRCERLAGLRQLLEER